MHTMESIFEDRDLLFDFCCRYVNAILGKLRLWGVIHYELSLDIDIEFLKDTLGTLDYNTMTHKAMITIDRKKHTNLHGICATLFHECFHANQYDFFQIRDSVEYSLPKRLSKGVQHEISKAIEHQCMRVCRFISEETDLLESVLDRTIKEMNM